MTRNEIKMTLLKGNLVFHIDCAKELPNTDWKEWTGFNFTDPFVIGSIGKRELFRTKHIENCLNPVWDEKFYVAVCDKEEFLKIHIKDDDHIWDDEVGTVFIPCNEVVEGKEIHGWFDLKIDGKLQGKIKILIQFFPGKS